ncbi:hypothetical protein [Bernardetia sp.]|uniref:hypothetical protein n=1 Tax=Bernardetia sp. TaxID=1937974 RepID=UPI0025C36D1A|nr:hypothetical protein [Bernardetia sp.]
MTQDINFRNKKTLLYNITFLALALSFLSTKAVQAQIEKVASFKTYKKEKKFVSQFFLDDDSSFILEVDKRLFKLDISENTDDYSELKPYSFLPKRPDGVIKSIQYGKDDSTYYILDNKKDRSKIYLSQEDDRKHTSCWGLDLTIGKNSFSTKDDFTIHKITSNLLAIGVQATGKLHTKTKNWLVTETLQDPLYGIFIIDISAKKLIHSFVIENDNYESMFASYVADESTIIKRFSFWNVLSLLMSIEVKNSFIKYELVTHERFSENKAAQMGLSKKKGYGKTIHLIYTYNTKSKNLQKYVLDQSNYYTDKSQCFLLEKGKIQCVGLFSNKAQQETYNLIYIQPGYVSPHGGLQVSNTQGGINVVNDAKGIYIQEFQDGKKIRDKVLEFAPESLKKIKSRQRDNSLELAEINYMSNPVGKQNSMIEMLIHDFSPKRGLTEETLYLCIDKDENIIESNLLQLKYPIRWFYYKDYESYKNDNKTTTNILSSSKFIDDKHKLTYNKIGCAGIETFKYDLPKKIGKYTFIDIIVNPLIVGNLYVLYYSKNDYRIYKITPIFERRNKKK